MSHSERFYLLGMKLDIQGVLVLMWSATVPLIYYSFPGDEPSAASLRVAYHTAIGLLAAACSAATLLPQLSGPVLGPARAALFAAFGAGSFLVPVAHGVLKCGLRDQGERIGLPWIAATGVFNGTGAVAYMLKVSATTDSSPPSFFLSPMPSWTILTGSSMGWAKVLTATVCVVSGGVVPKAV